MKLIGRIIAILIAAVISVLTVQQIIRRAYKKTGGKYIELFDSDSETPDGD